MKKQMNFRLDEKLIKELQKLAEKENRSLTNLIETILYKALKKNNPSDR